MLCETHAFCASVGPGLSYHNKITASLEMDICILEWLSKRQGAYTSLGICVDGSHGFAGRVDVGGTVTAKDIIIATGSVPFVPPGIPIDGKTVRGRVAWTVCRPWCLHRRLHKTAEYQSIHAVPLCIAWYRPSTTCYLRIRASAFPVGFHQRPCAEAS